MTTIAPAKTAFPDIKPFPGAADALPPRTHNEPPLDERIVGELEEAIHEDPGLRARINELLAKAKALPVCTDEEGVGKFGDFIKMCSTAIGKVEGHHERIKAPYLAATRAIDAKKRQYVEELGDAKAAALARINAYRAELRRLEQLEAKRIADEQARLRQIEADRLARIEAERAAAEAAGRPAPEPEPEPEPVYVAPAAPVAAGPIARGDLGSVVGVKKVWRIKFDSVRKLPDAVLNHPTVIEAIDKVLKARVRGGERTIAGCTIWQDEEASVR